MTFLGSIGNRPADPPTGAPLRAIMSAIEAGATTRLAIAGATGLRQDVVDAGVEHLLRMGLAHGLDAGCTSGSCTSCSISCRH